ncbi:N-acetylmuramoyl-L-alanine amidase [Rhodopseudomonas sp. AAP120]|uniref:N-acetylmuramoyl-L-alanine amidase n=1 Tax=Rhodopseudomonas sp. AAP120 TaxID=1523430 RepID=UPI000A96A654|nr:N-acetylmuramoyl-L-alanine amidase [Rhodopseudomonas sp. AAP120]
MPIEIKAHRIVRDGKAVDFHQTQNVGGPIVPRVIVLHDTAGDLSGRGSIAWLRGGKGASQNSSAHVVIGRDGTITQLASMNVKTWHAGISKWRGKEMLNGWSIGIEIANPGGPLQDLGGGRFKGGVPIDNKHDPSLVVRRGKFPARTEDGKAMQPNDGLWLEHSPQQIDAVVDLCRALVAAYPTITEIVTHWMIAPGRKVDTNPLFPLAEVRARVFVNKAPAVARFADLDGDPLLQPPEDDDYADQVARHGLDGQPAEAPRRRFEDDGWESGDEVDQAPGGISRFESYKPLGDDDGNAGDIAHRFDLPEPSEPQRLPKALVEFVQQRLRALGYYEVGNIDGDFAGRTEDALVTFKRHNGLPATTDVDEATLKALANGDPREVGDARASATPKDLRKSVPVVQQAGRSKLLAWLLGLPSAVFAVLQGIASNVSSVMSQLAPITGWLSAVPGWVWALLIVGIAAGIWWSSRQAEAETVDAYRSGRLT